jgi:hypothetical protein
LVSIPAHLESERTTLVKLYLIFLQHIALHECSGALYLSGSNIQYLDNIFGVLRQILHNEGRVQISGAGGLTGPLAACKPLSPVVMLLLRKNVVHILCGLSKTWLGQSGGAQSPPDNVSNIYKATLFNQFLPLLLSACYQRNATMASAGGAQIPCTDAQGLSLIAEIGGLLWTVVTNSGVQTEFVGYVQSQLLPGLGWKAFPSVCVEFMEQLQACVPPAPGQATAAAPCTLGVYKENFKKSIKALIAASSS